MVDAKKKQEGFSTRLRDIRLQRRWSQSELAHRARMNTMQVWHYERGSKVPRLPSLIRLADALGVTLDYLSGRSARNGRITVTQRDPALDQEEPKRERKKVTVPEPEPETTEAPILGWSGTPVPVEETGRR